MSAMAQGVSFSRRAPLFTFLFSFAIFITFYNFFLRESCPRNESLKSVHSQASIAPHHAESDNFSHSFNPANPLLRVYMYDLPAKFNLEMIHVFWQKKPPRADGRRRKRFGLYPDHQHMAEWYLYEDILKSTSPNSTSVAIRVSDPASADVFFVPFFSSLALKVYPFTKPTAANASSGMSEVDQNGGGNAISDGFLQSELVEWIKAQEPWKRSAGFDHVIPSQHPTALWKIFPFFKNSVFLLSDFAKFGLEFSSLEKDVIVPYVHRVKPDRKKEMKGKKGKKEVPTEGNSSIESWSNEVRNILLFFRGGRFRKQEGSIRNELFTVLQSEEGVIFEEGKQDIEGVAKSEWGMKKSKFCLNPAGDTPSSCRLFDSIANLCIPVIVSDSIELPFEESIDYSLFSVFVSMGEAVKPGVLVDILRNKIDKNIQDSMRNEMVKINHLLRYDHPNGAINMIWKKVFNKVPSIKEKVNRHKRFLNTL